MVTPYQEGRSTASDTSPNCLPSEFVTVWSDATIVGSTDLADDIQVRRLDNSVSATRVALGAVQLSEMGLVSSRVG